MRLREQLPCLSRGLPSKKLAGWTMRISVLLALLAGMLALPACSNGATGPAAGGGPGVGAPMFDARGTWQITTRSQSGATGGAAADVQQDLGNGSITGSLSNIQPACATSAALSGSVTGNKVRLSARENGQMVIFTGTPKPNGDLTGTFTSASGGCTNGDSGAWSATRTSGPN